MAINTYFKNIADAIRTKTGGSGLIIPANMPDEISDIVTGSPAIIKPEHTDIADGWYITNTGDFNRTDIPNDYYKYKMDMYSIETDHHYIVGLTGVAGNRFRVSRTNVDLYTNPTTTSPVSGSNVTRTNSPQPYYYYYFQSNSNTYLYISKTSTGQENIFTYVLDLDKL